MNIFNHLNYKAAIRSSMEEKQNVIGFRVTYEKLAVFCGIQKTYLSRALNSDATHLSEDQLYRAAKYMGCTEDEEEYLQLLRAHNRTVDKHRRKKLSSQIKKIRASKRRSESALENADVVADSMDLAPYFLDTYVMLVHMHLTIPRFQNDVPAIARNLQLNGDRFASILQTLESLGLIAITKKGYRSVRDGLHLPESSTLNQAFRNNMRINSISQLDKITDDKKYCFSAMFTADEDSFTRIKDKFLTFLSDIQKISEESSAEDIYQINFDLFDWSSLA